MLTVMNNLISKTCTVVATKEHIACGLGEESIILNFKDSAYYGLDEVGAYIWDLIQEPKTISEIEESILSKYDVEAKICKKDLTTLLEQLKEEGLIEIKNETSK